MKYFPLVVLDCSCCIMKFKTKLIYNNIFPRFQAQNVRDIILSTMQEQLMGRQYRADQAPRWAKAIANGVRQRVQELEMKR